MDKDKDIQAWREGQPSPAIHMAVVAIQTLVGLGGQQLLGRE